MSRIVWRVVGCLGIGCFLVAVWLLWVATWTFYHGDPREANVAERDAVQHLSQQLQQKPNTLIRLYYEHDGRNFFGIVGHNLIYDPVRGSLQDWFEYGENEKPALELVGVPPSYIHRIAQAGSLLDDLRPLPGVRVIHDNQHRYKYLPRPKKKTQKPSKGSASRASPSLYAALVGRFPARSILQVGL